MGIFNTKKEAQEKLDQLTAVMMTELHLVYKNKSSDEYKMSGDITKSPMYDALERMVANLKMLKNFPKPESDDLHAIFNVLHRPIFKKHTTEYIHEPSEKNMAFTCLFTVGYRIMVGELSRIYASTEATDKGIVYKPGKFTLSSSNEMKLIRVYKNDIESKVDTFVRSKMNTPVQESWAAIVGAGVNVLNFIKEKELIEWGNLFADLMNMVFGSARELNPLSFIDDVLSESYDKKVQAFDNVCANYEATKQAYEEYLRIPEAQRDKKIESNYVKDMEKYNIKMKNIQAEIKHYDQRANEEAKEMADKIKIERPEDNSDTKSSSSSTTTATDDDFDF